MSEVREWRVEPKGVAATDETSLSKRQQFADTRAAEKRLSETDGAEPTADQPPAASGQQIEQQAEGVNSPVIIGPDGVPINVDDGTFPGDQVDPTGEQLRREVQRGSAAAIDALPPKLKAAALRRVDRAAAERNLRNL